jgi:hypothetical protein
MEREWKIENGVQEVEEDGENGGGKGLKVKGRIASWLLGGWTPLVPGDQSEWKERIEEYR